MNKPLRLIELFAGYGSQALALDYLNIPYESWYVCDIDKYAIQSYNDIHGTNYTPIDITHISANDLNIINTDAYDYLLTYSFPCTDLSVAGKQAGMSKGDNTRSGLLWEVERLLTECNELPQYLLMENVPQVIGKRTINDFIKWCSFLTTLGYTNSYKLLNAKDFGIPQNRERCFMVSILNGKKYKFPNNQLLKLRLKDMLEDNVDKKYYLSDTMVKYITSEDDHYKVDSDLLVVNRDIACSKTTREGNTRADTSDYICDNLSTAVNLKQVAELYGGKWDKIYESARRIYADDGLAPTLHTCNGGNTEPKILDTYNRKTNENISQCLTEPNHNNQRLFDGYRIRKLTPKECLRLMGVRDKEINKFTVSDSQKYKQARK